MSDKGAVEEDMAADSKVEPPPRDGTPSSIESSLEQEAEVEPEQEQPAQPQKRKGGRKPVCL
jgi:hypothetical protein